MSKDFDIEAARKLVADIGWRPAARHYGLSPSTLLSRLKKKTTPPAPEPTPELEPEPMPESHQHLTEIDWSEIYRKQREAESPHYHG